MTEDQVESYMRIEAMGAGCGELLGILADLAPGIGGGLFLLVSAVVRGFAPAIAPVVADYVRCRAGLHVARADAPDGLCARCRPPEPDG